MKLDSSLSSTPNVMLQNHHQLQQKHNLPAHSSNSSLIVNNNVQFYNQAYSLISVDQLKNTNDTLTKHQNHFQNTQLSAQNTNEKNSSVSHSKSVIFPVNVAKSQTNIEVDSDDSNDTDNEELNEINKTSSHIHVTFNVSVQAANLLKKLASENFYRLREIGILSVKLKDEPSIKISRKLKVEAASASISELPEQVSKCNESQKLVSSDVLAKSTSQLQPSSPAQAQPPQSAPSTKKRNRKTINELTSSNYHLSEPPQSNNNQYQHAQSSVHDTKSNENSNQSNQKSEIDNSKSSNEHTIQNNQQQQLPKQFYQIDKNGNVLTTEANGHAFKHGNNSIIHLNSNQKNQQLLQTTIQYVKNSYNDSNSGNNKSFQYQINNQFHHQQQPNVIQQQSNVIQQQSNVIQQQSNVIQQQPNVIQQQPNVIQQQSNIVQQQPNVIQQQPNVIQQQPNVIQQQPNVIQQQPNVIQQQPNVIQQQSNIVQQQPNVIQQQPNIIQHHQSNIIHQQQQPNIIQQQQQQQQPNIIQHQSQNIIQQQHTNSIQQQQQSNMDHQQQSNMVQQQYRMPSPMLANLLSTNNNINNQVNNSEIYCNSNTGNAVLFRQSPVNNDSNQSISYSNDLVQNQQIKQTQPDFNLMKSEDYKHIYQMRQILASQTTPSMQRQQQHQINEQSLGNVVSEQKTNAPTVTQPTTPKRKRTPADPTKAKTKRTKATTAGSIRNELNSAKVNSMINSSNNDLKLTSQNNLPTGMITDLKNSFHLIGKDNQTTSDSQQNSSNSVNINKNNSTINSNNSQNIQNVKIDPKLKTVNNLIEELKAELPENSINGNNFQSQNISQPYQAIKLVQQQSITNDQSTLNKNSISNMSPSIFVSNSNKSLEDSNNANSLNLVDKMLSESLKKLSNETDNTNQQISFQINSSANNGNNNSDDSSFEMGKNALKFESDLTNSTQSNDDSNNHSRSSNQVNNPLKMKTLNYVSFKLENPGSSSISSSSISNNSNSGSNNTSNSINSSFLINQLPKVVRPKNSCNVTLAATSTCVPSSSSSSNMISTNECIQVQHESLPIKISYINDENETSIGTNS